MTEPENPLCGADPLARALAALQPVPAGLDRSRLLFLAGRADRDRAVAQWRWAFLSQLVLLVAVGGAFTLYLVRQGNVEPRVEYRDRPAPPVPRGPERAPVPREIESYPATPPADFARTEPPDLTGLAEYLRVRNEILTAGIGLIPDQRPQSSPPVSPSELERSLNLPPGVLTAPQYIPPQRKTPDLPD